MEVHPRPLHRQDTKHVLQSLPQDKTELETEEVDSGGRVNPYQKSEWIRREMEKDKFIAKKY